MATTYTGAHGGRHDDCDGFLAAALSSRGPDALPYSDNLRYLIRAHVRELCAVFPQLVPRVALFIHTDGSSSHLLQAEGTIPIFHAGVTYNLPAVIWLPEPYPLDPPLVYLTPTRDMVIKPNHRHVDRSGLVHAPYSGSWRLRESNLVDLLLSLSDLFGRDPPLFTRTSIPNSGGSVSVNRTPSDAQRATQAARNPQNQDSSEGLRKNMAAVIADKVLRDLRALRMAREAEREDMFAVQSELKQRGDELMLGLASVMSEKEGLEQQLQLTVVNTNIMEDWAKMNAGKGRDGAAVHGEDAFQPADVLSWQLLECTAGDAAVEDTMYELNRMLALGAVSLESYMQSVRALGREQFLLRALKNKVQAVQRAAQTARAPSSAPHYAASNTRPT